MRKILPKSKKENISFDKMRQLLSDQTTVILSAVDVKIAKLKQRIESFDAKLDKFLKRMTDNDV